MATRAPTSQNGRVSPPADAGPGDSKARETKPAPLPGAFEQAISELHSLFEEDARRSPSGQYPGELPSRDAIESAEDRLREFGILAAEHGWAVWDPNVTLSLEGEIVLEWWNGEKKLTIYVSRDAADFVKVWGPDIDSQMEDGEISGPSGWVSLWEWLTE